MTAETDLLPLPPLWICPNVEPADFPEVAKALIDYARANVAHATAARDAEIEALRAKVERLNRILGRIVDGDGDSTTKILFGTDAFAAAREYLLSDQEEGK